MLGKSDLLDAGVDFFFAIPIETPFTLTGFRHDHFEIDWGQPQWTVVTAPFAPAPSFMSILPLRP